MFKLLKWCLGFVVTIFTLILLAVIIVPMVFDPNDYREDITSLVKEQTGRDLILDGDLEVSVFPWIGIRTEGLKLMQPEQIGGEMVAVETAQLRVKFAPLLSKQVHVDTVVLEKPAIRLITLANGIDSFYGLTDDEEAEEELTDSEEAGVAIVLQGLELTEGNVVIDDRAEKSITELTNLNFVTGNLLGNELAKLQASGQLKTSDSPDPVDFELNGLANINVETFLVQASDLEIQVKQSAETAQIAMDSFKFADQAKIEIQGLTADIEGTAESEH